MLHSKYALIIISLLFILLFRFLSLDHNVSNYTGGEFLDFEGKIAQEPKILGKVQKFSVDLDYKNKLFITTTSYPEFFYGDSIKISGTLDKRLLRNKKPVFSMNFPKIELKKEEESFIMTPILRIRKSAEAIFDKNLSSDYSSLLLGIVFGIKKDMSFEFKNNLRGAGVMHVVAASGMNVTLVGGFLASLFGFLLKRQLAVFLSVLGIFFYALLSGFEASIVRASIMGALVFSSQILGRQNFAYLSLFIAGYAMLLFSPMLITDIGFQLSFVSTLGLLSIKPLFDTYNCHPEFISGSKHNFFCLVRTIINKTFIGKDASTTVSAQAASLPILLSNFGTYSLFSILANAVLLWTIPILMVIGGVGAFFGLIFEPLGSLILYFSLPFLIYFEWLVNVFGELPSFGIDQVPLVMVIGYYLILVSLILFFRKKNCNTTNKPINK